MILDNEFTGDLRVENEVSALAKAGYNVFVLAANHGNKPQEENYKGGKIIRVDLSKFRKKKTKALTNTMFDFYTPFWSKKIVEFIKDYNIDVLHAHDLYMLGPTFKAKKSFARNIVVVADLHENYPEGLKNYKFAQTFPGNILISIPKWERTEVEWVNKSDHIITVIEEAVERYKNLGVDEHKLNVVANYVNEGEYLKEEFNTEIVTKFKGSFVLTYIGGFDIHRGLESVIKAVPLVKDEIPNIKIVLVGDGSNMQGLQKLTKDLGVENFVSFEGWQPSSLGASYLKGSDMALIPHLKTGHTDNTIPHKLFQYMLLEIPVVASNCNPLQRIVEKEKCGIIFKSNNHESLAKEILKVFHNTMELKAMGKRGKEAVQSTYNWDETAKNLIDLYERVEKEIKK